MKYKSTYELLDFWFNNEEFWFDSNKDNDTLIYNNYSHLLTIDKESLNGKESLNDKESLNGKESSKSNISRNVMLDYLNLIILYDQITRHIDRLKNSFLRYKFHDKALEYSDILLNVDTICDKLLPQEICFAIMPYRHDVKIENIEKALSLIKGFRNNNKDNSYYRRFYYATIRSLLSRYNPTMSNNINIDTFNIKKLNVIDDKSTFRNFNTKFLNSKQTDKEFDELISAFKTNVKFRDICVSLSGGVDSMVTIYILKKLDYNVNAIHINYNNRDYCKQEVDFLDYWCQCIEVPLYVRNITEIQRDKEIDRKFYEQITKEIRFNAYKFIDIPIILGHNKDDTLENIITNISNKQNYDNLFGMSTLSIQNDIIIIRPMLNIEKKTIIKFANKYNIPYFQDSTPSWSNRGKLRDKLIPFMNSFNPNFIKGLIELSNSLQDMTSTYYKLLKKNTNINRIDDKSIKIEYEKCYDIQYWNMIFNKCNKKYNYKRPSNKSIKNLIFYIKFQKNNNKIMLSKFNYARISKDFILLHSCSKLN